MGLIKAAFGAAGGVLADQWKEFFYCEAIPADVLAVKGKKKVTGRSSNTKGDDNIITNGSVIAVANGQCMLIVEQGQIVDMCAEPGEYTYDTSTEPSLFTGDLGESIKGVFQNIGKRFTFGGEAPKDQRVYYFNTKELTGNKYGTPSPVPFRVVDQRAAVDLDIGIRCFGEYSIRLKNPMLFYTNVCGNVSEDFKTEQIAGQMKTELLTALQPAPTPAPAPAPAPAAPSGWVCSCGATATGKFCPECGKPKPAADGWTCSCGAVNKGKFCAECGAKKPAGIPQYKCDKCGWEPDDPAHPPKFCPECGDPFDDGDVQG